MQFILFYFDGSISNLKKKQKNTVIIYQNVMWTEACIFWFLIPWLNTFGFFITFPFLVSPFLFLVFCFCLFWGRRVCIHIFSIHRFYIFHPFAGIKQVFYASSRLVFMLLLSFDTIVCFYYSHRSASSLCTVYLQIYFGFLHTISYD